MIGIAGRRTSARESAYIGVAETVAAEIPYSTAWIAPTWPATSVRGIPAQMIFRREPKSTHQVFGVSPEIHEDSYVDRGDLDETLRRLMGRDTHIALRGESKCGKSWLRRQVIPDALVVQCRLGMSVTDIYRDALSQLGIRLIVESKDGSALTGRVEASGEAGLHLLARIGLRSSLEATSDEEATYKPVGRDLNDLRFIAEILIASGRRLAVEDFHYLSEDARRGCAFDIKTLWDYNCFILIVGIWNDRNLFLNLNPDLSGRVHELPIEWSDQDLLRIFDKGGAALNIGFSEEIKHRAIRDCFKNAGILQRLILDTLDVAKLYAEKSDRVIVNDDDAYLTACLNYVEELNGVYQTFANRVSSGIRTRRDATGIYAHAMAVVLEETDDDELLRGIHVDKIYTNAHARETRIQKGNLKTILPRIDGMQVDADGRGLVLSYNQRDEIVSVVDRQLLLYRRYATVSWPWADLIREANQRAGSDRGGEDAA